MPNFMSGCLEVDPLVSVIVPVYNGESYIVEAMESIYAQTYSRLEVIVVNDGSTDGSEEKLRPYRDRIRYIYKANGGIASAYNLGAQACTGDFVCFLEQDDMWLPTKVESQVKYLLEKPMMGMVFCRYFTMNEKDPAVQHQLSYLWPDEVSFEDLFIMTLERSSIITFSSVLMRKESLGSLMPFDEQLRVSVDYDAWLRLSYKGKLGFMSVPLLKYRLHDSNTSSVPIYALQDDVIVLQKWAGQSDVRNAIGKEKVAGRLWRVWDALRFCHVQLGDVSAERRCLMAMIRLRPLSADSMLQLLLSFFSRNMRQALGWYFTKLERFVSRH